MPRLSRGWALSLLATALLWTVLAPPAYADITVSVAAPGGTATETLPEEGGSFAIGMPLNRNMVNNITVSAEDEHGNTAIEELVVTQVSLSDVVISEFTSEPLPPERIEQLVNDGVIDVDDPENHNVSEFNIVLTIAEREVS